VIHRLVKTFIFAVRKKTNAIWSKDDGL